MAWHDGPGHRLFTVEYVSNAINILSLSSMSISVMCMCRCVHVPLRDLNLPNAMRCYQ